MAAQVLQWLADGLTLLGMVMMTIAVYGMIRMPDVYTRIHAASKAVVLGIIPILLAILLQGEIEISTRVILIGLFFLLTAPVSSHAMARAAYLIEMRDPQEPPGGLPGEAPGADGVRGAEPEAYYHENGNRKSEPGS